MKMRYGKERQAVAPVLATLLMIAVAVAMSVIIFMWSQGFLSQTSSATGGQQGAQNQAAQSSIAIETSTFVTGTSPSITIILRNVGAVTISVGSVSVTGSSSNSGFTGSIIVPYPASGTATVTPTDGTWTVVPASSAASAVQVSKGASVTITLSGSAASATQIKSGDVLNIKVTTTVGTFAQAQFTAP